MKENYSMGNENKVIFGSVIYQAVLPYISEFVDSLAKQSTHDFELLLINDGISEAEISKIKDFLDEKKIQYLILNNKEGLTPVELRIKLLKEAKRRGAEILVIGDSDDLFAPNRIEEVKNTFSKYNECGFVYNDLRTFDGTLAMPELPNEVSDVFEIIDYNFLGMSNTAIRVSALSDNFIESFVECKSYVFDWYLHTRLLLNGIKGRKAKNTSTYYRIYENNFVGIQKKSEEAVKKEIEVKTAHYEMLKDYSPAFLEKFQKYFNSKIMKNENAVEKDFWWNLTRGNNI